MLGSHGGAQRLLFLVQPVALVLQQHAVAPRLGRGDPPFQRRGGVLHLIPRGAVSSVGDGSHPGLARGDQFGQGAGLDALGHGERLIELAAAD